MIMKIHGSILANLQGAITSAARLRGKPVYRDTLVHWTDLLSEARRLRSEVDPRDIATLDAFVTRLEAEIVDVEVR
jgi:hypothetical protein